MIPVRDYPKVYVESAGGTFEEYVWVIDRKGDSSANIKWKCKFCGTDRVGPRLSIAAHIAGQKFGSLQVRACPTALNDVKAKIIQEEDEKKSKSAKRQERTVQGVLQSFAASAAANSSPSVEKVLSPPKPQSHEGPRLKQMRLELSRIHLTRCVLLGLKEKKQLVS